MQQFVRKETKKEENNLMAFRTSKLINDASRYKSFKFKLK
jgi:hypothetical protein